MEDYPISQFVLQLEQALETTRASNNSILAAIALKAGGSFKLEKEFITAINDSENPMTIQITEEIKDNNIFYVFTAIQKSELNEKESEENANK